MSRLLESTKPIECWVFFVLRIKKKHSFVFIIFAVKVWLTQIWWGAEYPPILFDFFSPIVVFQELIHSLPEQQQEHQLQQLGFIA